MMTAVTVMNADSKTSSSNSHITPTPTPTLSSLATASQPKSPKTFLH
jgi:hypothetical protein